MLRHFAYVDLCLYTGNPQEVVFINSEDSDEMLHIAAFHQILHYLLKIITTFVDRSIFQFRNSNLSNL